jgi:hypothetical protein
MKYVVDLVLSAFDLFMGSDSHYYSDMTSNVTTANNTTNTNNNNSTTGNQTSTGVGNNLVSIKIM